MEKQTYSDPIDLTDEERRRLKQLARRHRSAQRDVLRANIVLLASLGLKNFDIAVELRCDRKTVRKWRSRFCEQRLEGLSDRPRSGRPQVFSSAVRHQVFSVVVEEPPQPFARWTIDLLVGELVQRGTVASISRETVSRWLRTADLKPHRVRYWLTSKDPDFQEKKDRVVALYAEKPTGSRVICIDEKTSIQALERCHPDYPARPGLDRRVEFEYKRHGVTNLIASFDVYSGEVLGDCVDATIATLLSGSLIE